MYIERRCLSKESRHSQYVHSHSIPPLIPVLPLASKAIWDYADAFATLYNSGLLGHIDPKKHQVVLCGHSAGAVGVYVVLPLPQLCSST